ncbi:MAG: acyl-CoA dehydrogenase family protein, partial [Myxococcales bacterium]|nr:acyl-CoA dehydrogenase family protein [Myxococcales bacterium]
MDFDLSADQLALREAVARFCKKELWYDDMIERDHEGRFSREGWDKAAEFGFQGMPIPTEYGGQGYDILSTAVAFEALGYGSNDPGLALAISAHLVIVTIPIWQYGTEDQKRRYLPDLASGRKIGAYGLTEPEAGSDAFSLRTTATRKGDHWVLNGQKTFITNGPIADYLIVFATIDRSLGSKGITAFIVHKDFPGFGVARELDKMGLRTSPTGELFFENCEVPAENVLGEVGGGAAVLHGSLEWERALILTRTVGAMQRELEACVEYANTRVQFGKPIGKNQAISHKIADMKV